MDHMGMSVWLGHSVQNGSVIWIRWLYLSSTGECSLGTVCGSIFAKGLSTFDINNVRYLLNT